MMSLMMEMMGRMMLGGRSNNYFSSLPVSPPLAMGGYPMSPAYPMTSLYNNPGNNNPDPWLNNYANQFTRQYLNDPYSTSGYTPATRNNRPDYYNSMNGIWQALSGDILVIFYNTHFIWSNGNERYLSGSLIINGANLSVYIPKNNNILNFKFYRENNKFAVKDSKEQIHVFTRIH